MRTLAEGRQLSSRPQGTFEKEKAKSRGLSPQPERHREGAERGREPVEVQGGGTSRNREQSSQGGSRGPEEDERRSESYSVPWKRDQW